MKKDEKKTRIAVVRCDIVSEVCPGVACLWRKATQNALTLRISKR